MKNTDPAASQEGEVLPEEVKAVAPASPDLYAGRGGSFRRDPVTGERIRVAHTAECVDCAKKGNVNGKIS